jgi:hypothetical protein
VCFEESCRHCLKQATSPHATSAWGLKLLVAALQCQLTALAYVAYTGSHCTS